MITTRYRVTTAITITMAGTGTETERGTETEIETGSDTRTEETEMHDSGTETLKSITDCVLLSQVTGA